MIRIIVDPRLVKTAKKLGPEIIGKAEAALQRIATEFGSPHKHSGLGIRKLRPNAFEARVWLQWRIVLVKDGDVLRAFDIMNHDQVAAWLKGR